MKSLLASTLVLALSAPLAMAEVTLSGSARMGILQDFGSDDTGFTSRARVSFALSGETDGGLSFGATFRADNATDANIGEGGEVFLSGAFGKLTMGDIDGAAQQAVGNVDGVGLTNLDDLNEMLYIDGGIYGADGFDPTAAYEYSTGPFTGIISVQNPANDVSAPGSFSPTIGLGARYAADSYSVALGYETNDDAGTDLLVLGGALSFGAVSVKANYGRFSYLGDDYDQWHLSATYSADALSLTAFYSDEDEVAPFGGESGFGLGAAYDLGGGAKVMGGYVRNDTNDTDAFDMGLSFAF
jgi:outer membrane protein OmpU